MEGMIYSRGSSEEYDRLANISGDAGWSWENLQPYVLKDHGDEYPFNLEVSSKRTANLFLIPWRLRSFLTEEVGPRDEHLAWVSTQFAAIADAVHESLGHPKITLENSWSIFGLISSGIEELGPLL
ncbi:hypothetical protein C8R47DRAFT_1249178 [Mycena vitilis]|nr:hypothetical protein C8R47DRAFT_1249178 [Mycena vitilis]